jgi:carnosine N-methyltransferase
LSLEDVIRLTESIGFKFEPMDQNKDGDHGFHQIGFGAEGIGDKTRTIPSEYTADRRAMMKWVYQAEFWIARKNACYGDIVTW